MMQKLFFFLLLILFSCNPPSDPNLPPDEEGILGIWHEIADKRLVRDSLGGSVIDSIDVSAVYEFKSDFTYTSQNEVYTKSTHGRWEFDSVNTVHYIYPVDDSSPTAYRQDRWEITLNPPVMDVWHTYDHVFPNGTSGAIYFKRKFIRIP